MLQLLLIDNSTWFLESFRLEFQLEAGILAIVWSLGDSILAILLNAETIVVSLFCVISYLLLFIIHYRGESLAYEVQDILF